MFKLALLFVALSCLAALAVGAVEMQLVKNKWKQLTTRSEEIQSFLKPEDAYLNLRFVLKKNEVVRLNDSKQKKSNYIN